jgi:aminocarboxymuconate-semialdehyde decarboxylase
MAAKKVVDIHTHVYPPRYLSVLRSRTSLPLIRPGPRSTGPERLIILPDEDKSESTSSGRPIGPEYYDIGVRLEFMRQHKIDVSVIRYLLPLAFPRVFEARHGLFGRMEGDFSLANPWLDFLPGTDETLDLTKQLNSDLNETCQRHPDSLWAFGVLPSSSSPVSSWLETLRYISTLSRIKGVILGTKGLGNGLDDPTMDPIWQQLEKQRLMTFLHPHYGIPKREYGERENGHVLPLALGFPFETTIVWPY